MTDQNSQYDPYYPPQPQIIGYDEYGQPVYQRNQHAQRPEGAPEPGQQGYGGSGDYDPYAQAAPQYPQAQQYPDSSAYPQEQRYQGYDDQPEARQHQPQPYQPEAHQSHADQPYQPCQPYQGYAHQPPGQHGHDAYDPYGARQWQTEQDPRPSSQAPLAPHAPEPAATPHTAPAPRDPDTAPSAPPPRSRRAAGARQQARSAPVAAPAGVPGQRRAAPEPDGPADGESPAEHRPGDRPDTGDRRDTRDQRDNSDGGEYRTEQFAFVDESDEESEDAIDWLKFTESRSERREEAKRRGRNRIVALCAVLALALVGGVGYLWYAGMLPGMSGGEAQQGGAAATGPQKRDVIVLHLHNTKDQATSTALLVDNATTKQGSTVLLPNALAVTNDDGTTTTLGKSVEDDGSSGTREAIGSLLGTKITGTWRLDTPYLENLVELVGGVDLTTDAEVPAAKEGDPPVVRKGENQTLDGRAAVAYATYRDPGESEDAQLQRFGQVVQGVLRKMSDDPESATVTVQSLAQILDPSLPEKDLGASLAKLAEHAKTGAYKTALLPVEGDGRLTEDTGRDMVEDILGGSVTAPEAGSVVRVGVRNASGDDDSTETARIVLVNGGYAVIDGGRAKGTAGTSEVLYADEAKRAKAEEVAKTLGLPPSSVRKGEPSPNAEVTVVLGRDYEAE
ncbi:LytR C-terminal domain-containing protein [Streptomyces fradiae]|uniref:LytR C-terminal domain-containing protein n=1 Tax=Streptomyces fradiae TaxID=1906 RepID=UPI0035BE4CAB